VAACFQPSIYLLQKGGQKQAVVVTEASDAARGLALSYVKDGVTERVRECLPIVGIVRTDATLVS
jgi:hypothetical protein